MIAHMERGTDTPANRLYYRDMPDDVVLPIAGLIREEPDPRDLDDPGPSQDDSRGGRYRAELRPGGRLRRNSEVKDSFAVSDVDEEDSSDLFQLDSSEEDNTFFPGLVKQKALPDFDEKKILTRDFHYAQEDSFLARPSVKLVIPDHIKAILVDDWENVTKNQQLVPLPAKHPVNSILKDYVEHERLRRQPGSAQADILEEVVAGLSLYFDKCLGRILLYR
jgi:hypothetical protein